MVCLLTLMTNCSTWTEFNLHCLKGCNSDRNVIEIGIYELADAEKINKATYDDFANYQDDPAQYLGSDLINIIATLPLEEEQIDDIKFKKLDQRTTFIAIVGYFYQADLSEWKIVLPVENFKNKKIKIEVDRNKLIRK